MSELVQKLGIDWKLLLANATTFFIVFWLLKKFAYKPLLKVLEDRQKTVAETVAKAKQVEEELRAIQRQEREITEQAKTEALKVMHRAQEDAEKTRQRLLIAAEQEAARLMEATKEALVREKTAMLNAAKGELAEIIVAATTTVIVEQLDADLQQKLARRALANVGKSRS